VSGYSLETKLSITGTIGDTNGLSLR